MSKNNKYNSGFIKLKEEQLRKEHLSIYFIYSYFVHKTQNKNCKQKFQKNFIQAAEEKKNFFLGLVLFSKWLIQNDFLSLHSNIKIEEYKEVYQNCIAILEGLLNGEKFSKKVWEDFYEDLDATRSLYHEDDSTETNISENILFSIMGNLCEGFIYDEEYHIRNAANFLYTSYQETTDREKDHRHCMNLIAQSFLKSITNAPKYKHPSPPFR